MSADLLDRRDQVLPGPLVGADAPEPERNFPFSRNSTAFAVDYVGSYLRGCYEGWQHWLRETGTPTYAAGDMWGCVGAWFSGDWHSAGATRYLARVRAEPLGAHLAPT